MIHTLLKPFFDNPSDFDDSVLISYCKEKYKKHLPRNIDEQPKEKVMFYILKHAYAIDERVADLLDNVAIDAPDFKTKAYCFTHGIESSKCRNGNYQSFTGRYLSGLRNCGGQCACSLEDQKEGRQKTLMERYGVENVSLIPGVVEKTKQTMLKNYGVTTGLKLESLEQRRSKNQKHFNDRTREILLDKVKFT